jgi:ATP-dependent helicase/nuclease subunit B
VAVRLIAGRAGSGKTHWCQAQICEALASSLVDGPRLIMLVPEQAALQMERSLVAMTPAKTLGRCEVLSFRRLAHRILNETAGPTPAILSPIGRQMALRYLIGRHRKALREFGKVADRTGVIAGVARCITELLQECISPEQLEAGSKSALDEQNPSGLRLHDMALLYRAYLDYLGSERVDPEGVLDLARSRLDSAAWLSGVQVWIDGFAGLTQQQVRMIVALAGRATQVDIALLLDPDRGQAADAGSPLDDLFLFARTERTWSALVGAMREAGVPIEKPVLLGSAALRRFTRAPLLGRIEKNLFSIPKIQPQVSQTPAPSGEHATVRFIKAASRRAEVTAAVSEIVDLVQRPQSPLRYRDTSIVVRDLEPYHELISTALRAREIPFFIDRRRPTHHHALIQFVRAALSLQGQGPFDKAIIGLLKSGLSGLEDEAGDALENYLLAYGLASPDSWDEPWTFPMVPEKGGRKLPKASLGDTLSGDEPGSQRHRREVAAPVDQFRRTLREKIGEWWPAKEKQSGRPACRTWLQRLYGLLERFGVGDHLASWCDEAAARGDLDEAEEHEQIWSDLIKLLDEVAEMLGDETMTARAFRDVLESGLAEFTLGLVPATLDQVLVSSIERSRHPSVRAVFVLGFNDGLFPARHAEDSIFGDEERSILEHSGIELARSRAGRLLDERMLAYVALTRPSEFLWISYSESDESGKALAPSAFWPYIQAVLPEVPIDAAETDSPATISSPGQLAAGVASHMRAWCESQDEAKPPPSQATPEAQYAAWLSLYDWARSTKPVTGPVRAALKSLLPPEKTVLSQTAVAALWRPPYHTSVTRLESFAACPFQHFAAYGLRLAPRPVHEIAAVDMGRLYHLILEQFVNELMESGSSLTEMSPGRIAESLSRLCRSVVPQYAEAIRMEQHEQRAAVRRGERELPAAVRGGPSATGKSPLQPIATETTFGDTPDHDLPALTLKLSGNTTALVSGVIDRIDAVRSGDVSLAVVFDYKRSVGRKLRLDEVYHGLALQLLAYLLVLRDHGKQLTHASLTPGGTFYLPLLGSFEKVDHPDDANEPGFDPYKSFRPRGVIDFDWIDMLDPTFKTGRSSTFSAFRTTKGEIGHIESTDAVSSGALPRLLDHVRRKMVELAEDWLAGNIAVTPARLGKETPCSTCLYGSVCRIEYATRECRVLRTMKRIDVLEELARSASLVPHRSPYIVQESDSSGSPPTKRRSARPTNPSTEDDSHD